MTTTFRHGTYKDRQNTSYMGSYTTDYNTLCEVFGEPTHLDASSDGKIKAEWVDRKSTRLNSSHIPLSRMPSSA